jgi:hypothetical protein
MITSNGNNAEDTLQEPDISGEEAFQAYARAWTNNDEVGLPAARRAFAARSPAHAFVEGAMIGDAIMMELTRRPFAEKEPRLACIASIDTVTGMSEEEKHKLRNRAEVMFRVNLIVDPELADIAGPIYVDNDSKSAYQTAVHYEDKKLRELAIPVYADEHSQEAFNEAIANNDTDLLEAAIPTYARDHPPEAYVDGVKHDLEELKDEARPWLRTDFPGLGYHLGKKHNDPKLRIQCAKKILDDELDEKHMSLAQKLDE